MQQAVIFVRVSKKEQDYQRQVEDLRALAQSQVVGEHQKVWGNRVEWMPTGLALAVAMS